MATKGYHKPRLCRICAENDPAKFIPRYASVCRACVYIHRRESQRLASAAWRTKHPEQAEAIRKEHAEYNRQYSVRLRARNKIEVLTYYSPNQVLCCSADGCVVDDIDMLVLDHIYDNGAAEKRKLGGSNGRGHIFYAYLKSCNFPCGYQTLCCNHNHKKELVRNRAKNPQF